MSEKAAEFKVAVCQLTSVDSVQHNVREIEVLLNSIAAVSEFDLICFPENSLYMRVKETDPRLGLTLQDESIAHLSKWSQANGVTLHIGSVPLIEGGRFFNASLLLRPDGGVNVTYRKIHLFDVDVEGHAPQRESDFFAAGSTPSTFLLKGWRFGSSICYDIRFAELYLKYAREGVDAILVPAAFIVPTGKAHWDTLIRARAIESQAYVIAAAQGGVHHGLQGGTRETFGHSMIVDPWGQILAQCPDDFAGGRVLRAILKADRIEAVRRQIPMKNHRKLL